MPSSWSDGRLGGLAEEGVVYVQDVGSQLVARLLARPGTSGRILDACAAPGGKALLIGDVLRDSSGRVVAAEAALRRLGTLGRLRDRWGATNVFPLGADARRPPFATPFDGVLVDAPCSGLGTLARHPDIRWSLRAEDLARQGRRQQEILEALAPLVRPGGRLVYATCSVEDEENEGVVGPLSRGPPRVDPRGASRLGGPLRRRRFRPHGPFRARGRRLLCRGPPAWSLRKRGGGMW